MARIRTLKPEWLEDERLAAATDAARLLSVAVILLADDHGRGRANTTRLAADVWGYRDDPSASQKVAASLRELVGIGFLRLYRVRGQSYYEIVNWRKHQRIDNAGKPRVPEPSEAEPSDAGPDGGPNGAGPPTDDDEFAETRGDSPPDPDPDHDRRSTDARGRARDSGDSNVVPIRKPADRAPGDLQDAQRVLERLLDAAWLELKAVPIGSGGTTHVREAAAWIWQVAQADPDRWLAIATRLVRRWAADPYLREKRIRQHPAQNFAQRVRTLYEDECQPESARYQLPSLSEIDERRTAFMDELFARRSAELGRPAVFDDAFMADVNARWPDEKARWLEERRAEWERSA